MARDSHRAIFKDAAIRGMSVAWLTLIVSLLITGWTWYLAQAAAEQNAHDRFAFRIDEVKIAIADRMRDYEAVLRGAKGLFNASEEVTPEEWRAYVQSLNLDRVYPGIQVVAFVKRVPASGKEAHTHAIRAKGFPGYAIRPPGRRAEYAPVIYLEPFAGRNLLAFGYDISSEPVRRAGLERARDTGEAAISGKITLVQETGENTQAGFIMFLPIYRKGAPTDTVEQRRNALEGYVDIAFRMEDLMRGILSKNVHDVDIEIFDGAGMTEESLMYDHDTRTRFNRSDDSAIFSHTTSLDIHGHAWTLHFSSLPAFEASIDKDKPRLILAGGAFISLLFFVIAWSLVSRRASLMVAEAQTRQLSSAVEQTADAVVITDRRGIIEYVNPAYEQITGYSRQEVLGKNASVVKSGEHDENFYGELWRTILAGRVFRGTMVNRKKDGSLYYEEKTISPLRNADGNIVRFVSTGKDITQRLESEERLHYLAHHDPLTGLPNRVLLQDRLKQAMLEADRSGRMVAALFLDLDRFKTINDTLGHQIGDVLLKTVAERLATCLRASDTVSRLGGDEFTIVLANVASVDDVTRVAQKILDQFVPPFHIGGRDLFVSSSIGITLYPLDEKDPGNLLKDADVAMYHAKELGGNVFQFYTPALNARAARRLELETGMRRALERQEFVLHYQPLVDMQTGQLQGMEALLRWQHPELGLIAPLDFIPLAEETGLIIPIGEWVLKTACAQIKAWHDAGFPALQVAINLSSKQLRDKNLIAAVKQALTESGLDPRYLDLELTESVLMQDMELAAAILKELKTVGVFVSLDDFGTGYSSLSYLKRFPIDYLKIDRSFVHDITADSVGAGLVKAIIAMANVLHIKVIAEGVETYEQLDFLRRHGCDIAQGYFCSKPVAVETFTEMLRNWDRLRAGKCGIQGR